MLSRFKFKSRWMSSWASWVYPFASLMCTSARDQSKDWEGFLLSGISIFKGFLLSKDFYYQSKNGDWEGFLLSGICETELELKAGQLFSEQTLTRHRIGLLPEDLKDFCQNQQPGIWIFPNWQVFKLSWDLLYNCIGWYIFVQSIIKALNINSYCQIQAQTNFSLNLWKLPFIFRIKMGSGSIAEDSF